MLVSMKEILDKAKEGRYAVPAPNVDNEHNVRACIEIAEEMKSPLILGFPFKSNPDIDYFGRILRDLCEKASVPIAINLDHGENYEHCVKALRAGFTGIMVDRSTCPYEQNVAEVKELVKIAHALGVSVEAELGHVGGGQAYEIDGNAALTVPDEAARFVEETGVDCLAVAIGTAHGFYKGEPYIRFDLLEEIAQKVPVPLVLHGGSGSGDENLAKAAKLGICKVNLSTDLKESMANALINADLSGYNIYGVYRFLAQGFKDKLAHYIRVLDSEGKAW